MVKASFEKVITKNDSSFLTRELELPGGFPFGFHYHPECELTLVFDGYGRRFIGHSVESFAGTDLVLVAGNVPHSWYTNHTGPATPRALVVKFDSDKLFTGQKLSEFSGIQSLIDRARRGLVIENELRENLIPRLNRLPRMEPFIRLIELLKILQTIAVEDGDNVRSLCNNPIETPKTANILNRIDRIIYYLNEHFQEDLKLPHLAEFVGMSPSVLCREFKKTTKLTVISYLNTVRTSHALRLLRDSDLTVAEIAFESGFRNLSNFNRRFREHQKCSPTEFRSRWKVGLR